MADKMESPKMVVSYFVCNECRPWALPLRVRRPREDEHITDFYCPFCGKVTKHTECKDLSDDE